MKEKKETIRRGIRVIPGLAFRTKRKGFNWSIGPKLTFSKRLDPDTTLRFRTQFLPLKLSDLESESRLDYAQFDLGLTHFLNRSMYVGGNLTLHSFDPSGPLKSEVARRGGTIRSREMLTGTLSVAHQILKVSYRFRHTSRLWPIFLQVNYTFAGNEEYGADLGLAGSSFPLNQGFSWNLRPFQRKF